MAAGMRAHVLPVSACSVWCGRTAAAPHIRLVARPPARAALPRVKYQEHLETGRTAGRARRFLVREARALGLEVIDRCNLTVLQEPGQEDLPAFLAAHQARGPARAAPRLAPGMPSGLRRACSP